ncbi:hypothetical protein H6B33_09780 [Gemmiger formicilis]|uniref:hypothetical protein n=1 Tax=Gemmiger formicilis TaxID=745368 RepID=UPI0019572126|nr:hypothetical protein [Gemmiger formicilis]MBM6915690.1 hypothetical protein [Gemmiger formicilis]
MKKRLTALLILLLVFALAMPLAAFADIGPKPSVRVTFTGAGGREFYATLLSQASGTGPYSAEPGRSWGNDLEENEPVRQAMAAYQDPDGFYFLQTAWQCSETRPLAWTYYPPVTYKLLVYFPDTGEFLTSGVYSRYAFDNYYTVDLADLANGQLILRKSYDYTWELVSLLVRILATIALELAVAVPFGFAKKPFLRPILTVNVVTQILLNLGLNMIAYWMGGLAFMIFFWPLEVLVFIVEAVAYRPLLGRRGGASAPLTTIYAFTANVISCVAGFWLAQVVPGIF